MDSEYKGRVSSFERISKSVRLINVKLTSPTEIEFEPGQYLALLLPDSDKVSYYSIASSPHKVGEIELLVKEDTLGEGACYLFSLKAGNSIKFKAPMGDAFFRQDCGRDLIFAVGTSGASYARSILHYLVEQKRLGQQQVYYFMGAYHEDELMESDYFRQLDEQVESFHFIPAVSHDPEYSGEIGLITDVMERRLLDNLYNYDAYSAGPEGMVNAVAELLMEKKGLKSDCFFSDLYSKK
ncbi:MAG: NADH:ubiquinone oxidoreductase, na translocating, f subunit [Cycloclasticus sp. symbiont of Poecilosclerida sp. M]|nr:MAG: NADH:ubiquinone oxidoreductase, na translocating, f subunit [Cycloclasticus sp. symbiont of Poecilosclerida sp. M]